MPLPPISLVFYRTGLIVKQLLYLRDPPTSHHSPSSSGYRSHAVSHRKTRYVFFKPKSIPVFLDTVQRSKAAIVSSHLVLKNPRWAPQDERFLLKHAKTLGFLASRREEFNPGPEMRLDCSELLCNKVLLKYKGDREIFWHRHQKGAERVPHQDLFQWVGSSPQSINQVLELQLQPGEFHGWRHCFA